MAADWQISVGDVAEVLRPASYAVAALLSAWVLYDSRRREGFGNFSIAAWTLLTLALPPVFLPLYLAARLFTRSDLNPSEPSESTATGDEEPAQSSDEGDAAGSASILPESAREHGHSTASGSERVLATKADTLTVIADEGVPALDRSRYSTFALPLAYALTLFALGGVYFYLDYRSFDAHLGRAERAKLYQRRGQAVVEYRAALARRDDAHTRKLLGLELLESGRAEEALVELRAAQGGGEPDEKLHFHVGRALDSLGRRAEAAEAYRRFLQAQTCAQAPPHTLCGRAGERLNVLEEMGGGGR